MRDDAYFSGTLPDAREALKPEPPKSPETLERERRQRRRKRRIQAIHIDRDRYVVMPNEGISFYAMLGFLVGLLAMAGLSAAPVVGPVVALVPGGVVFVVVPFLVAFLFARRWPD